MKTKKTFLFWMEGRKHPKKEKAEIRIGLALTVSQQRRQDEDKQGKFIVIPSELCYVTSFFLFFIKKNVLAHGGCNIG